MFDMHCVRLAWSRARCSAGMSIAMSSAMMPMTTSNSTSVKAWALRRMGRLSWEDVMEPKTTNSKRESDVVQAIVHYVQNEWKGICIPTAEKPDLWVEFA